MVENQHKLISGYRDLPQWEINIINEIKKREIEVGGYWRFIINEYEEEIDKRWMNIARTHFEEGFSAFVRAIAQPEERF